MIDTSLSVNALAASRVAELLARANELRIRSTRLDNGVTLIDCGIEVTGSLEAGRLVTEICMGGLGRATIGAAADFWASHIEITSGQPVLSCLGSQYAGWSLAASKEETGGKKFFALGSGPVRAMAQKEDLFKELGYRDQGTSGVLVMEVDKTPPQVIIDKILRDTGLPASGLTLILTPTTSLAGSTQVVGRVLEVALHKAHVLGFPLEGIIEGTASAPLPSPHPDGIEAMGRTNDAILYGGRVHLTVNADDAAAAKLAKDLPSINSRDYGRGFADIFRQYEFDFYKIDPQLFAPAEVWVSNVASGKTYRNGKRDLPLLERLWGENAA